MSGLYDCRGWLIGWMYCLAIIHFIGGLLLVWAPGVELFSGYHQQVLSLFWRAEIPAPAYALEHLWFSLFGATLQNLAIFMGILIYLGNRYRNSVIWLYMMIGTIVWAIQDIVVSLKNHIVLNMVADTGALLLLMPALILLWIIDRKFSDPVEIKI